MSNSILDLLKSGPLTCSVSEETWYQVFEDRDKEEGRDGQDLRYCVNTRTEADILARGLGVYGSSGRIAAVNYLKLTPMPASLCRAAQKSYLVPAVSPVNEAEVEQARLRASAISKLTPEEWKAIQAAKR